MNSLRTEHPNHPGGPDPECELCNPTMHVLYGNKRRGGRELDIDLPNVPGDYRAITRYTGNRHNPGGKKGSTVVLTTVPSALACCVYCRGLRNIASDRQPGPHSPHLRPGKGLVDCVGRPIRQEGSSDGRAA